VGSDINGIFCGVMASLKRNKKNIKSDNRDLKRNCDYGKAHPAQITGISICFIIWLIYPASNGNASETKANESFDNGVFFDIEAKRTPSLVS
jgi:hypothetical protein